MPSTTLPISIFGPCHILIGSIASVTAEVDQPGGRGEGWFPGQDGSWLIVASAAGAARNPAWYYNMAAHPNEVEVEMNGRTIPVTAEQLHGAERDEAWRQITAAAPASHSMSRRLTVYCRLSAWYLDKLSASHTRVGLCFAGGWLASPAEEEVGEGRAPEGVDEYHHRDPYPL